MIATLLIAYQAAGADYTVPLGSSTDFHRAVIAIEKSLSSGQFERAKKLAFQLPKANIKFKIVSTKVPKELQQEFFSAIRMASKLWKTKLGDPYDISEISTGKPDIVFSFEPKLAMLPDAPMVAGAASFLSEEPVQPRLETVIGLNRGNPIVPVSVLDIYNESLASFGTYLGLASRPVYGISMGRVDTPMLSEFIIHPTEQQNAVENLKLANRLRVAIQKKTKVPVNEPSLFIERTLMNFPITFQGDPGKSQIVVSNRGSGTLLLKAMGDCACIDGQVIASLKPGQTSVVKGFYSTESLSGEVNHNVILTTNDPERPVIKIPAKIYVKPRIEFIFPQSSNILLEEGMGEYAVYLNSIDKQDFKISYSTVTGISQPLKVEPFKGTVFDSQQPNRKVEVNGYKLSVDLSKVNLQNIFGRIVGLIYLKTDHPTLPNMQTNLTFQKGIVALPESLYVGALNGPKAFTINIIRPQKPFQIQSIKSSSNFLKFKVTPKPDKKGIQDGSDYIIEISYDGKAPSHVIDTVIEIKTDDVKQPLIRVPIQSRMD